MTSILRTTLIAAVVAASLFTARLARCEDSVNSRMKLISKSKEKITLQADTLEFDRKANTYTAVGNVKITQGPTELTADKATLNETTGDAEAIGKARLVTDGNILYADHISLNYNTSVGVIEKGRIFVQKENYHIEGKSLSKVSDNEYIVYSGKYTTCDAPNPFWQVTASKLDVRMDQDVRAKDVVVRIKDIPVLYTPYAWFPLLKPRTSGFLLPGFGYSTKEGVRLITSYYWAPLDNFDTTLKLDFRSRRGLGINDEARFALNRDSLTYFSGYFMDDRLEKKLRYNVVLRHQQLFTPDISGRLDVNLSDKQFYRDLTDTARERTQRTLDSNLFVTDRFDWGRVYLFSQYTQVLDLINDNFIVQRLPEVGANVLKKQIFGLPLYLDLDSSATYFLKQTGVSGGRADAFPKVSGYFNLGGINFSPRIGYRETAYELSGKGKDAFDDEKGLFGSGIKAQTDLYRLYTFKDGPLEGIRHTVEPAIAYNYVIRRGGTQFPVFDGVDTYTSRNELAYSLTNRFVIKYREAKKPGRVDYLTLKLSQFYDFHKLNILAGKKRAFSSLYGEVIYKAGKLITVNNDFRYDFYSGTLVSVNTDVRYDAERWHFALGQRFSQDTEQIFMSPSHFDFFTPSTDFISDFVVATRTPEEERLNFLTLEAGVKVNNNWGASGKIWYDVHRSDFRETDLSVDYTSQCWGITANYVHRPNEKQFMVVFRFKGLGNVKI